MSLLISVVLASDELFLNEVGGVIVPLDDEVWRWFTTPFVHDSLGYQFAALLGVGIFGTLLERRFGPVPVVIVFVLAGAAGAALAVTLEVPPLGEDRIVYPVLGANGAALGLSVRVARGRPAGGTAGRGPRQRPDRRLRLGRGVVLLSLAVIEANVAAAVGGAVAGAVLGLALPLFTRKSAF